ncbi:gliding motility-associated C-terminal domain-containing protein [Snuella lapsa]|uniref:Gliding motility-associated C-terminal domain-containing protein n=1 Tax=Snuella lapsa TaxID=870481 RepID=A0ABP6XHV5_9FLAO
MRKFTTIKIVAILFLCFTETIEAQLVISKPNLGFSQACAGATFNTYYVTFSFSPETELTATNQFTIELSDETGDFSTPTIVYTSSQGSVTTSPATLEFSIPDTTAGEAYKIRIKSSSPVATSTPSNAFAAYYKIQDTPFSINNLIENAVYCAGESYLLTIDNPGFGDNDSPLQYPSLTFNWYKQDETNTSISVFVASGSSLEVTEAGTYFVETNYGSCTSNSYSNRVTVSEATTSSTTTISSSLGNPYCSSEGETTLSTINGNSYQWYKDGDEIDGATNQNYITSDSGNYSVTIDLGDCVTNASIDLETTGFNSSIDVQDSNTIQEGETLVATVSTNAMTPQFEWYLNGSLIPTATGASYEASQVGNYKVVVTQTEGCVASHEMTFSVSEPYPDVAKIPNVISPNGDGENDTWIIPKAYVNGTNTEVLILSSEGEVVLQTNDYQNNWPTNELIFTNINPVFYYVITTQSKTVRKGSITVIK